MVGYALPERRRARCKTEDFMPKRKRRDIDLSIHPENKYKGILYTADRKRAADDDLPHAERTRSGRSRRAHTPGKFAQLFGSLSFFHVKRTKDSKVKQRTVSVPEPQPQATGGGRVLRSSKNNSDGLGGFFRGHLIRNTCLVCCAVVAVSFITVQTTLAKPGTAITLIDNGREMQCETLTQTVGEFLNENGVMIGDEDALSAETSTPIYEGQIITIYRAVPIAVRSNAQEIDVNLMAGRTVQDALDKAGIVPAEFDEVYPSPDTIVRSGMVIDHIIVTTQESKETQPIAFDTVTKNDPDLEKGKRQTVQDGQEGVLQITYTELYKNGVLIDKDSISEDVIQQPVDQVIAIGTYVKPEPKPVTPKKTTSNPPKKNNSSGSSNKGSGSSGSSSNNKGETDLNGKQGRKFELTAYCSACNTGSKTSSGTYPVAGRTVACNSLPLGTRIMIEGFGEYVVEDRGGMGGNVIDIYLGDRETCTCGAEFGRKRNKTVYVL